MAQRFPNPPGPTECRRIQAQLSPFLDHELCAGAHARVALHLARCPGCRREERALAAVVAALHRLPSCRRAWPGA